MVAHPVTQGIARPSLYKLVDSYKFAEGQEPGQGQWRALMQLTYKLCFMYYNWTGAIKVPAPTMMAHKLAYLVGSSVHTQDMAPSISETMYYL
mmetsp:Transcript_6061/g.775  ORF Transcript_6061/g.775 Transcript_6061/m.775 type:complete len:93 (+) Transcript_6061:2111-2389(+)